MRWIAHPGFGWGPLDFRIFSLRLNPILFVLFDHGGVRYLIEMAAIEVNLPKVGTATPPIVIELVRKEHGSNRLIKRTTLMGHTSCAVL